MHSVSSVYFVHALCCLHIWTSLLATSTVSLVAFYVPSVLVPCCSTGFFKESFPSFLLFYLKNKEQVKLGLGSQATTLECEPKLSTTEMCLSFVQHSGAWCTTTQSKGLKFTLLGSVPSTQEKKGSRVFPLALLQEDLIAGIFLDLLCKGNLGNALRPCSPGGRCALLRSTL